MNRGADRVIETGASTMRGIVLAISIVATASLVALAPGAGAAPARIASNYATYADPTGDQLNSGSPDITTTTVSSSDSNSITFNISIPNKTTFTSDMQVLVAINADMSGTGYNGYD